MRVDTLSSLEKLIAKHNPIDAFDAVEGLFNGANGRDCCISSLDLRGCPLIKLRRYRDRIVLLASSLTELDGRDISPTERIFLENFYSRQIGGQPVAHFPGSSASGMNRSAFSSVTSAGQ